MITPGEIRNKALKKYTAFLKASVLGKGDDLFPLVIPGKRGKSTDNFMELTKWLQPLIKNSKSTRGFGYSLEFDQIKTRKYGDQQVVRKIFFESVDDYLAFIGKKGDFCHFVESLQVILSKFPALKEWIVSHVKDIAPNHDRWEDILNVCDFFVNNPRPDMYIRELPLEVHTKFIEDNRGVLRSLLDTLLPPEAVNFDKTDFADRYYLKTPQQIVRFRILDPDSYIHGLSDISVPLSELGGFKCSFRRIIIVENKMTFLTFPSVPGSICIWGQGNAVTSSLFGGIKWLAEADIYYWGDIDPQGFEILSRFRGLYPHTRSFLMDEATYEKFYHFTHDCEYTPSLWGTLNLGTEEGKMYQRLLQIPEHSRLEQERVAHKWVVERVSQVWLNT